MHKTTVIDFKELGQRYCLEHPIRELKAERLADVGWVLEEAERYQDLGCYVAGYLSYEAAAYFDPKLKTHEKPLGGEYFAYFTVHEQAETEDFPASYAPVNLPEKWVCRTAAEDYQTSVAAIRQQIRQGNTYQVNYTVQLEQPFAGDSLALYNRLVCEQDAGYNAYIAHDDYALVSASPELFFKTAGQQLLTRPMKGTAARQPNWEADQAAAAWLQADPKNRAENLMIVDLLRNDMGKICETGSVTVSRLCETEAYSTVWQLTSTIEGRLKSGSRLQEILAALYPCGSITGAPKLSTMAIIHDLEPQPRGVYCGTVGLLLPDGRRFFTVPIRTVQLTGETAIYGVGGGITWDSRADLEYEEIQAKSAVLYRQSPDFDLVTTGRVSEGSLVLEAAHIQRLRQSAAYFGLPFDEDALRRQLAIYCRDLEPEQDHRLRISLSRTGAVRLASAALEPLPPEFRIAVLVRQDYPLQSPFTYFKTSHRPHLRPAGQEQIYVNPAGQLLETTIGNLVLALDGRCYTPPAELGILPGLYRQHLLDSGQIREKLLTLADLQRADKIYACNAVRGLYELQLEKE